LLNAATADERPGLVFAKFPAKARAGLSFFKDLYEKYYTFFKRGKRDPAAFLQNINP
jgi:hypothetical protein